MRLPITAAAALLPPFFTSLRTSASSVDALASTLSPEGATICAWMWQFERLTTRRVARCSAMGSRVLRDRRRRASILFIGDLYPQPGLLLLRLFDHDSLVVITHALALVRLRRAIGADFRRNLPDLLLIDPLDEDFGLPRRSS